MQAGDLLIAVTDKDTSAAYSALMELEKPSESSDILYPHIDLFTEMISSDKYVIRVRGFRLFCKQARWDKNNIIGNNLDKALHILSDEKPTAVRQTLSALK